MQKTDPWFVERIGTLMEERWRPPRIFKMLEDEAREAGRSDAPSERTVRRLCEKHVGKEASIRRQYAYFRWPGSMKEGALPWEASAASLELLRYRGITHAERPTVRLSWWFWHVTLAVPDLDIDARIETASYLAANESDQTSGRPDNNDQQDGLDWYLAYHPWSSEEDGENYAHALTRKRNPVPPFDPRLKSAEAASTYAALLHGDKAGEAVLEEIAKSRPGTYVDPSQVSEKVSGSPETSEWTEPHTVRTQATTLGLLVRREKSNG